MQVTICAILTKAYGEEAMKNSNVWVAHPVHRGSPGSVRRRNCRPGSHRTDENVEKVWNWVHSDRRLVHSDRRLSIRTMAVQLNLDREAVT